MKQHTCSDEELLYPVSVREIEAVISWLYGDCTDPDTINAATRAVERCAQCQRRHGYLPPGDIDPDSVHIVVRTPWEKDEEGRPELEESSEA